MNKAVFLDRDGVLNCDYGYVYKVDDLKLIEGVGETLKRLKDAGYLLLVITNQPGVARGYYTLEDVDIFHAAMQKQLQADYGVKIDEFYVCPHHVDGKVAEFAIKCECRKPAALLPEQAIEKYDIDRGSSFFVGDKDSDMECAKNISVTGIQVGCSESDRSPYAKFIAADLKQANEYM